MASKITHIIHHPRSGIGTLIRQLIDTDKTTGNQYTVILLETDPESENQFSKAGAQVLGLSIRLKPFAALKTIRLALANTEIIHIHSFLPQLISAFLSSKSKKKIRTIHNSYPYFHAEDLRSKLKRTTEGLIIRGQQCDLVCVSEDIFKHLPWKIPATNCTVIENGVSTLEFSKKSINNKLTTTKPEGFLFVALGRVEHQKGFDTLVDAFNLARNQAPDTPIKLWIIGEGSCRAELEKKIHEYGLGNHITLLGYKQSPQHYLAMGDAFVMPSRHEGFALSAIEAMFLGLPVILTQIGGLSSKLTSGLNAHLVEKENPAQLAKALIKLSTEPDYCQAIAKAGMRFSLDRFSIETCLAHYLTIYSRHQ